MYRNIGSQRKLCSHLVDVILIRAIITMCFFNSGLETARDDGVTHYPLTLNS